MGVLVPFLLFSAGLVGVGVFLMGLLYTSLVLRERRRAAVLTSAMPPAASAPGSAEVAGVVALPMEAQRAAAPEQRKPAGDEKGGGADAEVGKKRAEGAGKEMEKEEEEEEGKLVTFFSTALPVSTLLLWVWTSAQSCASLFSQAQALAPSQLASLYGILSALQLQGFSEDARCQSNPFLGVWVGLAVCATLGLAAAAAVFAPPHYFPARLGGSSGVLSLSFTGLALLYGPMAALLFDTLTCTLAAPMRLFDYASSLSDGRAYRETATALGSTPFSTLQAAVADPQAFPQVSSLLERTFIPVSVQASNPAQVCREGSHLAAWWAAGVGVVLFSVGFPLLGAGALWGAGKCKGLRRRFEQARGCCTFSSGRTPSCCRARAAPLASPGGQQPPPHPTSSATALLKVNGALQDETLQSHWAWFTVLDQAVLLVVTGLVALSVRITARRDFAGIQGVIGATALGPALLLLRSQPYKAHSAWKRYPAAMLYGLTVLTALTNAIAFQPTGEANTLPLRAEDRLGLGVTPLVYSAFLLVLVLVLWWMNGYRFGVVKPGQGEEGALPAADAQPSTAAAEKKVVVFTNPLHATPLPEVQPPPSGPRPMWRRHRDADGDLFWVVDIPDGVGGCEVLSSWDLPEGAETSCGWRHCEDNGLWCHMESGAVSRDPPELDPGRAERERQEALAALQRAKEEEERLQSAKREEEERLQRAKREGEERLRRAKEEEEGRRARAEEEEERQRRARERELQALREAQRALEEECTAAVAEAQRREAALAAQRAAQRAADAEELARREALLQAEWEAQVRTQVEADKERVEAGAALQRHMEKHGEEEAARLAEKAAQLAEEAAVRAAEEERARVERLQLEKSTGEGLSKEFLFLVGKVKKVEGRLKGNRGGGK